MLGNSECTMPGQEAGTVAWMIKNWGKSGDRQMRHRERPSSWRWLVSPQLTRGIRRRTAASPALEIRLAEEKPGDALFEANHQLGLVTAVDPWCARTWSSRRPRLNPAPSVNGFATRFIVPYVAHLSSRLCQSAKLPSHTSILELNVSVASWHSFFA
jgi:hypothetical protein